MLREFLTFREPKQHDPTVRGSQEGPADNSVRRELCFRAQRDHLFGFAVDHWFFAHVGKLPWRGREAIDISQSAWIFRDSTPEVRVLILTNMAKRTKLLLISGIICLVVGAVLNYIPDLFASIYFVFPVGAVFFGLFLISLILEREDALFGQDHHTPGEGR